MLNLFIVQCIPVHSGFVRVKIASSSFSQEIGGQDGQDYQQHSHLAQEAPRREASATGGCVCVCFLVSCLFA